MGRGVSRTPDQVGARTELREGSPLPPTANLAGTAIFSFSSLPSSKCPKPSSASDSMNLSHPESSTTRTTLGACHLHHLEASRNFVRLSRNVVTLLHNHGRIKRRHRCIAGIPHNPRICWSTHSPSERCLPSSMIRSRIRHRVSMRYMVLPTRMPTRAALQSVW
jgi:hypothetical protein